MDELQYQTNVISDTKSWLRFPKVVSIETYSICNARCTFCPYTSLERKKTKMPDHLIDKILSDIESTSQSPAVFNLSRVNEPFLDKRVFDIAERISARFPTSKFIWFSNGTTINNRILDKLLAFKKTTSLNISFNDHRKEQYEKEMGIKYDRAISAIEQLHNCKANGLVDFNVNLSRVGDGTSSDSDFLTFCKEQFPLFKASVSQRFDWIGAVDTEVYSKVPEVSCSQWTKLHILADGNAAFCCIDSNGALGLGNAYTSHVINDIYNHPEMLGLRQKLPSRREVEKCKSCRAFA